ncbi:MAG: aminoacyl-tRNA hydrolase [Candidatus Colwellbacteria bacterium]|nr:aminoacyl-tRNA hydrolase [Candidatus Colwellbacteria bacterium]
MLANQSLYGGKKMEIKLLIGLGNPGPEYESTYHNVGHLFIDSLAGETIKFKRGKQFEYIDGKAQIAKGKEPVLIKSLNFMNQSGEAVAAAKKHFKVKSQEILIVHDDSDIALGRFKLSFGRGSAGHQGVESIIKSLKTNRFHRLRIGIRPPIKANLPAVARRAKAGELVLRKISAADRETLKKLFEEIKASLLAGK